MNRRKFIHSGSALAAWTIATNQIPAKTSGPQLLSGIQCNPIDFLDEGIETCLDFMQKHARINAIFCYSQTYHLGTAPLNVLAKDHPVAPRDPEHRNLPYMWMRLSPDAFSDLPLQHGDSNEGREYGDRDIFNELVRPCRDRGIKIYARILEAGNRRADRIPGYLNVSAIDIDGDVADGPCWNNPYYREWIRRTVEQMMKRYPLDGLQYGAERVGSLSEVLFRGKKASCFCRYCRQRNADLGVDTDRVAEGFRKLQDLVATSGAGKSLVSEGIMTGILRILFNYPEILTFYREWLQADAEIQGMVYRTAKQLKPDADVGQHIDHQRSSWDIFYRAVIPYSTMVDYNDYIKPILYHEILGPRMKEWVIDEMQSRVLSDLSRELALELFYSLFGHDSAVQPSYQDLEIKGFSPEYVFNETRRCVVGAGGKAKVYAGIGIDVPHYVPDGMKPVISDPDSVERATSLAIKAGADGVVASREYREMTVPSMRAFGHAVRDATR